jgi:hypothetical protein
MPVDNISANTDGNSRPIRAVVSSGREATEANPNLPIFIPFNPGLFPVRLNKFPDLSRREIGQESQETQALMPFGPTMYGPYSRKFPVVPLLNRETASETGSLRTACAAN